MPLYRFYFLDKSLRTDSGCELDCDSDRDAHEHALRMGDGRQWELWRGQRKVASASPPMPQNKEADKRIEAD